MTKKKYGVRTINGNEPDPETGNINVSGGGSQDLQETLENGDIADFEGGNSRVKLLKGDPNSRTIELTTGDGSIRSSLALGNTFASLSHSEPAPGRVNSNISATNEGINLSNNDNGTNGWYNMFKVPYNTRSQTTYTLPIDRPNGNYTLATTSDIMGMNLIPTLDQVVEQNPTIIDKSIYIEDGPGGLNTIISSSVIELANPNQFGSGLSSTSRLDALMLLNQQQTPNGLKQNSLSLNRANLGVANYSFPEKDEGNYTLATTDDFLTYSTPGLQDVVDKQRRVIDNNIEIFSTLLCQFTSISGEGFYISSLDETKTTMLNQTGLVYASAPNKRNRFLINKETDGIADFSLPEKPTGSYTIVTREEIYAMNATTTALSNADLNTTYPNANPGFQVICDLLLGGGGERTIYIKSGMGWLKVLGQLVL